MLLNKWLNMFMDNTYFFECDCNKILRKKKKSSLTIGIMVFKILQELQLGMLGSSVQYKNQFTIILRKTASQIDLEFSS